MKTSTLNLSNRAWIPCAMRMLLLAIIPVVTAVSAQAQQAAPVLKAKKISKLPATITSPGLYVVSKDISFGATSGTAIKIQCDNVTIDLAEHRVTSTALRDSTNQSVGIAGNVGVKNITIQNGVLQNFRKAIVLDASFAGSSLVDRILVDGAGVSGIRVNAGYVEIRRCRIVEPGYSDAPGESIYGIYVQGINAVVHDNLIAGLQPNAYFDFGIFFATSYGGEISQNIVTASSQVSEGIYCGTSAGGGVILRENYVANADYGIEVSNPNNSKLVANSTFNCANNYSNAVFVGNENK